MLTWPELRYEMGKPTFSQSSVVFIRASMETLIRCTEMTDVFAASDAAVSSVDKIKLLTDSMYAISPLHVSDSILNSPSHTLHISTFISLLEPKPSL